MSKKPKRKWRPSQNQRFYVELMAGIAKDDKGNYLTPPRFKTEAAEIVGVSRQTISKWHNENPHFVEYFDSVVGKVDRERKRRLVAYKWRVDEELINKAIEERDVAAMRIYYELLKELNAGGELSVRNEINITRSEALERLDNIFNRERGESDS